MKRILLIALVTLTVCAGCNRDAQESVMNDYRAASSVQASHGVSVAVTAEQGCTKASLGPPLCWPILETAIVNEFPDLVQRNGQHLGIKLTNGEIADVDDGDRTALNFVRYFPEIHYGLLSIRSGKNATFDLFDMTTGERTNVGGDVVVSPDKRRLAVFHEDLVARLSPNILAVYFVNPKGLFEEYRLEPEHWGVEHLNWINDETISIGTVWFENNASHHQMQNIRFAGDNIAKIGTWEIARQPIENLLDFGRKLAAISCENPTIAKEDIANKYDDAIQDVQTTATCPSYRVISRTLNNLKPPVTIPIEVTLHNSTKNLPPYGLSIGAPRSKIFDALGEPSTAYFDEERVTYDGPDEGGCSSGIDFTLKDGAIKEISWGFCYE